MHNNSINTYKILSEHLSNREEIVLKVYSDHYPTPISDKYVLQLLEETDPNRVRPRVTGLLKKGRLVETGKVMCPHTNQMGRHCRLNIKADGQLEMFKNPTL